MELAQHVKEIEEIVFRYLPKEEGYEKTIYQAMNYTMQAGGKRLRPMLMLETYRLFGGNNKIVYPFMAAIEMIHTYSLIHDDLPALDNDDYRRGRKTAHIVFGEDMAILAGDALLNYAFEVASTAFDEEKELKQVAAAYQVLARKPGVKGMIGGQVVDVELTGKSMTKEQMMYIYELKTGALIEASMMIGAILAGADQEQVKIIEKIASQIGLAFQIQDDVLDLIGNSEVLGKPIASDEKNEKMTYATFYGVENAQKKVEELTNEAMNTLRSFPMENLFLEELLEYLIHRDR